MHKKIFLSRKNVYISIKKWYNWNRTFEVQFLQKENAMNRNDIKEQVSMIMGLTKRETDDILDCVFETIKVGLKQDGKVTVVNFGSFRVTDQGERTARNPRTGEAVHVPAKTVVKFKPAQKLKDIISG